MSTNVLLHVNALHTTPEGRTAFYRLLKENLWIRMHPVYMTWCSRYSDDVLDVQDDMITEIKALAAQAGVRSLHAVAQCGNEQAFWFEYEHSPLVEAWRS